MRRQSQLIAQCSQNRFDRPHRPPATDDASEYERHLRAYFDELQPAGQRESDLAQSIADTSWRLKRIPGLESAIYAQGHVEFADAFAGHDPALRPGLIELHTFLTYEKQLRNLQLQEARLHRRREKDNAELARLQQERNSRRRQQLEIAAKLYAKAQRDHTPFEPRDFGFEFSIQDLKDFFDTVRAPNLLNATARKEDEHARAEQKAA